MISPRGWAALALIFFLIVTQGKGTTLPPELKAYDFGEAYYIEDGGVVISPYAAGFYCPDGTSTPEGIRVMPGQGFVQIDSSRKVEQVFKLIRLNEDGSRAFFREHVYTYETSVDQSGRTIRHRMRFLSTDDFYLTRFRGMEPFDHVFTNIELNPGARVWAVSKN